MAALLESNEEITEALKLYEDLERVGIEREAEARSRKETRIDRSVSVLPYIVKLHNFMPAFSTCITIKTVRFT